MDRRLVEAAVKGKPFSREDHERRAVLRAAARKPVNRSKYSRKRKHRFREE